MAIQSYTDLNTLITTTINDNTTADITPAEVRATLANLSDLYRVYGSLLVYGAAVAQSLNATPAKITAWAVNGTAAGTTPDHTTDLITVGAGGGGVYEIHFSATLTGIAGTTYSFRPYVNATAIPNVQARVKTLTTDAYNVSFVCHVAAVAAADTISLYGISDAGGGANVTTTDAQFAVKRIG